jgi:hypothetical protein
MDGRDQAMTEDADGVERSLTTHNVPQKWAPFYIASLVALMQEGRDCHWLVPWLPSEDFANWLSLNVATMEECIA